MAATPIPRPTSVPPQAVRALANAVGAQLRTVGSGGADSDRSVLNRTQITGITNRSADVRPGDLFAAMRGQTRHGASAVPEALDNGAVAVLTDPEGIQIITDLSVRGPVPAFVVAEPRKVIGTVAAEIYGRPSDRLLIIGLTGTSGKTTTSYLVEAGLIGCGLHTGVIGTVETRIGSEVLPSAMTTPEAPDLQALLQLMVERGVQAVAMEVSSHALAMDRVAATNFAVGGFTNLSHDHLDFHHDLDEYFRAKALLFDGRAAAGVVDIDGEYGRKLKEMFPELITVSAFGGEDAADWTVPEIDIGAAGITNLAVRTPRGEVFPVALELPGSFNISNALLALACIDAAGLDARLAAPMLAGVVVPGRMQSIDCGQDFLAIVDYAHKPGALDAVLTAVRPDTTGRVIVVIGAGGDRDQAKRPMMGSAAAQGADLVIVTDDNPRTEDPAAIRAEILAGVPAGARGRVREIGDRREAIRAAVQAARPGDAVLVTGKGHEQGQYVGDEVLPFSDAEELADALRAVRGGPVKPMTVDEVAAVVGADPPADGTAVVESVEFDTRKLRPGGLFVALAGEHVDGHDFAADAARAGAVAVLGSRPVDAGIPVLIVDDVLDALARLAAASAAALIAAGLTVVGITGSAGKTSTKDLVAAVARAAGETVAPPESFNNELGHPYTVLRATASTRYLVLELSARGPGHIAMLARIAPPRIGVVLNVGTAHLGEFGSVDSIARAKGELVEALPNGAHGGVAVLNADDPRVAAMQARTQARVVGFGSSADADVYAADVTEDDRARAGFTLVTPEGSAPVQLAVAGRHQVGNALAAAAVGIELGLSPERIADVLTATGPASKWRMEITERADGVTVINDAYNANPDSMKAALRALATIGRGRRTWAVLGEMAELGGSSRAAHDEIGRLVVRLNIDRLLAVGPAVRPLHLGAHLEGSWGGESEHVADVDAAAEILRAELRPNDVVLVKASRAAGLERVAAALLADEPARPAGGPPAPGQDSPGGAGS